jgi:predicted RNA binding protein YcfA (HicA-like mRNA interferase family)
MAHMRFQHDVGLTRTCAGHPPADIQPKKITRLIGDPLVLEKIHVSE